MALLGSLITCVLYKDIYSYPLETASGAWYVTIISRQSPIRELWEIADALIAYLCLLRMSAQIYIRINMENRYVLISALIYPGIDLTPHEFHSGPMDDVGASVRS
jgi:hypothetical protein